MNKQEYGIFNPKNPIFLSFAKWIVILSTLFIIIVAISAISQGLQNGGLLLLGSIPYYFSGMVFVNMLYNIKDIKDEAVRTTRLLKEQLEILNKNETD
jgi:hypothetical protein